MARQVERACAEVGQAIEIDFAALFASDIASRARAYKALIEADIPAADARLIVGFDD